MKNYKLFHSNNIPIEIHYTLIKNINDREKELYSLIDLLRKYCVPIKFIKFNPTKEFKRSDNEELWANKLRENINNLVVKKYSPPGRCIGSSCGEFTKHYYLYEVETKEEYEKFLEWKKEFEV